MCVTCLVGVQRQTMGEGAVSELLGSPRNGSVGSGTGPNQLMQVGAWSVTCKIPDLIRPVK